MTEWETPKTEVPRDRFGRPLIIPEGGAQPVAYTRATTFVDVLEDKYNLQRWMQRNVALGLVERPDLILSTTAHRDNKQELDRICDAAQEHAKAHAAATTGTALHALTERLDRGQDVGIVPDAYMADLLAYQRETEKLAMLYIEQFCVQDPLKVGGTPDVIFEHEGKRYIGDKKTGSIEYGIGKIAMQLAVYARSKIYDPETGKRTPHGCEIDKALIIHLPAGTGTCELVWVDIMKGWNGVMLAKQVRGWRTDATFKKLTTPFSPQPELEEVKAEPFDLTAEIRACLTVEALHELWAEHSAEFEPHHIELARAKKASLARGNPAA